MEMNDDVTCKCGNRLFRVGYNFDIKYIWCLCPICRSKIYLVGPEEMYAPHT